MVYSISEIQQRIAPVAQRYGLRAVFLFGSYARGTANEHSDIDLLIDTTGTPIKSLLQLGAVYSDLEAALEKPVDLITVSALEQRASGSHDLRFRQAVERERRPVYVAA